MITGVGSHNYGDIFLVKTDVSRITISSIFCERLYAGKKHSLAALGRYYKHDILWKITKSSNCILLNAGILHKRYNMAFL